MTEGVRASLRRVSRLFYQVAVFITARRVVVRGMSMYPTLSPGEYVLFNRLAYLHRSPQRGDIVLARDPRIGSKGLIKRVVGVPGESIQIVGEQLLVNGIPIEEPPTASQEPEGTQGAEWLLGEGECFLLGDARDFSTDSRSFGPVPRKAIKAKAWLVYWPLSRWRSLNTPT